MPKWTENQELAINESSKNIIVSAGAGSGKTAVLTERVIRKLINGVDINNLLILTFTSAAASEMKERIRSAIIDNNLTDQLLKIDSSFITTFDSFALSVVKKYHYLLNIDQDIKVANDLVLKFKKQELLDNIFDELYENEDELFLKYILDFTRKDDSSLKNIIFEISNKLDLKYDKLDYLNCYINNYYNDNYIDNRIDEYLNIIFRKIDKIKENLRELELIIDGDYYYQLYSLLKPLLNSNNYLDIKNNLDIKLPIKRGLDDDAKLLKSNISKYIKELKNLTIYESTNYIKESILKTKDYVKVIINIIKELDNRFNRYKKELKLYDYLDIAKLAIKLVKEYSEVRDELKNSFKEILLDEYQDTSDLQEEFINLISDNNIYMVGDIKQSIYRFRNANPNLFKNKYIDYSNGINGIKIDLLHNFRSRREVLDNINLLFDEIMDLEIGGADYKKSHRMIAKNSLYDEVKSLNQDYNMEILNYELNDKEYSKEEIEAFITVNDIKKKIDEHFQVFDKKTSSLRDITYDDIAILLDKSNDFELYRKIFEYYGITLTIIKNENLAGSYDLLILKNILLLLLHIKERVYDKEFWYCYLSIGRSYLFSLSDEYLYNKINNKDLSEDMILSIANNIVSIIDELPLPNLIEKIINEFSFYEKLITVGNIDESIIRLDYIEKLSKELGDISYTYKDFIKYFNTMILNNEKIEYPINNDIPNSVKIMTIHKSKGLEYPICYFPNLLSKFNTMEAKQKFFFDNTYGIVTPYIDEGIRNTIYKTLFTEKYMKEEIGEKIRLFYVALTRAKEKMIFITSLKESEDDNEVTLDTKLKYYSFSSILNSLSSKLKSYIKNIDINSLNLTKDYTMIKNNDILNTLNITDDKLDVKELSININKQESKHFSKSNLNLLTKEEKNKLELGTNLHRIFELVDFKNQDISYIDSKYQIYLKQFFNSNLTKNIKNANIYKEYEFIYQENNNNYHGVIDLMLEYDDYIDIIDYKLMNIDDSAYLKQLKGYEDYISKKTNKKIRLYLYSIIEGTYKEIK